MPENFAGINILCMSTQPVKLNLHSYHRIFLASTYECSVPGSLPVLYVHEILASLKDLIPRIFLGSSEARISSLSTLFWPNIKKLLSKLVDTLQPIQRLRQLSRLVVISPTYDFLDRRSH